jgi:hypothetical protein
MDQNLPVLIGEVLEPEPQTRSTIQRPPEKLISRFGLWQLGDRTIRYCLEKGHSLGICCRRCTRMVEWTPPELLHRFGSNLDLPLKVLVPRLVCTGEDCGSHDLAVFPHFYDLPWTWPPQADEWTTSGADGLVLTHAGSDDLEGPVR